MSRAPRSAAAEARLGARGGRLLDPARRHGRVLRVGRARAPAAAARSAGHRRRRASAASSSRRRYEARAFGVHAAMPMAVALRQCPQAIVVPPDHHAYHEVSAGVMQLLGDVTALVEQVSVDEAFLDVAGARRRLGPPTVIAALIRRRVREQYGITCSVGIGSTKFVAKLASGHAKPDGVLLVPRRATVDFLRSLPVGALWGVGERTEAALARWGIRPSPSWRTATSPPCSRRSAGSPGAHLSTCRGVGTRVRSSRGAPSGRSAPRRPSSWTSPTWPSSRTRRASWPTGAPPGCGRSGLVTRTVSVKVRTSDLRTLTRSRTLPTPTDVGRELYLAARELIAGRRPRRAARPAGRCAGRRAVAVADAVPTTDARRRRSGEPARGAHGRPSRRRTWSAVVFGTGCDPGTGLRRFGGVPSRSTTTFVPADLS